MLEPCQRDQDKINHPSGRQACLSVNLHEKGNLSTPSKDCLWSFRYVTFNIERGIVHALVAVRR